MRMMHRKMRLLFFASSIPIAIGLAKGVSAADKSIARGQIAQTEVPVNKWILEEQPLPSLHEIVNAPAAVAPVYGLYSWSRDYYEYREQILDVGWPCIRLGGPVLEGDGEKGVVSCAEDGKFYILTVKLEKNRSHFDTDKAFLDACEQHFVRVLDAYGPDGKHSKENPAFADNPLRFVEVWAEPNFKYMIPDREPREEVEAEREALYGLLLKMAYRVIKEKAPSIQVIGFCTGGGGSAAADRRFIEHSHQLHPGLGDCYDILSTHPYMNPAPPEAAQIRPWGNSSISKGLAKIHSILAEAGVGPKPIWYTEMGWSIPQAEGGAFADVKNGSVSPAFHAAYIVRAYAWALRLGVPHAFIMYIKDVDGYNGGFFENDKKWRPAAHAVKAMIGLMPHPKLLGAISDCEEGVCIYRFQANAKDPASPEVIMAWNVEGPKLATIPVGDKPVRLVDMLGHEQMAQPSGGSLTVEIGPFPIYLVLPKE